MSNALELQLRKVATALTVALVVIVLWSVVRLTLLSEPEAIAPASSSLLVANVGYNVDDAGAASDELTARPLFWQGRQRHSPVVGNDKPAVVDTKPDKSGIKDVQLVGVYRAGKQSGIIVLNKGKRQRLRLNESLGNWTFSMMSADGAIFESGDDSRVLDLQHAMPAGQKAVKPRVMERAEVSDNSDNKGE